jgi:ADP-ribosyl-[dinitrogen reductase] hydrolase
MTIKKNTQLIYTSQTSPLKIAEIQLSQGKVGLSLCPGKHGPRLDGGMWQRDLTHDLTAVKNWGASTVVSLIEPKEFSELKVENLSACVEALGMKWFHLPIKDGDAPDERFELLWPTVGALLTEDLTLGNSVFVHCKGGLGRAGTVASLLLMAFGSSAADAMAAVRAARVGAIETKAQERWLDQQDGSQ